MYDETQSFSFSPMSIVVYLLILSLVFLSGLVDAQTPFVFSKAEVVKEDFNMFVDSESCPSEFQGMKGRYIELGTLAPKPMDKVEQVAELSPLELSSLVYLKRVAELEPKSHFALEPLGVISPYVIEMKKAGIRNSIKDLHQHLKAGGQSPKIVAIKQDEALAMSLYLFPRKDNPFKFIGGAVALLKEGDDWKVSATPASFANTNLPYEGGRRMCAVALENWATQELPQRLAVAAAKHLKETNEEIVHIRLGLRGDSAETLSLKLAETMTKRDPMKIAAILNLEGGAAKVMELLTKDCGQNAASYLDRLCSRRNIIVPLDPKPLVLTKEQELELKALEGMRGSQHIMEKNGEEGQECALGVILVRPDMRFVFSNGGLMYMPLYVGLKYLPARQAGAAPSLGLELVDTIMLDWELGRVQYSTTRDRMARDFHRSYPAFQFKTPQTAAASILPALQGEYFTDLLRCLPPQDIATGADWLDHIDSLLKLSESAGSKRKGVNPFENVVIYEYPTEALVFWKFSAVAQEREQISFLLLRKNGDYWYLCPPLERAKSELSRLEKAALHLGAMYEVFCRRGIYCRAVVLEAFTPENFTPQKVDGEIERVQQHVLEKDLMEHCLALEETLASRERMAQSVQEHLSDYGHKKPSSVTTICRRPAGCFIQQVRLCGDRAVPSRAFSSNLLEAPMLMYIFQNGGVKWAPELTLFAPITPERKQLSEKRLQRAKQFLAPEIYREYLEGYKAHCQWVLNWARDWRKVHELPELDAEQEEAFKELLEALKP